MKKLLIGLTFVLSASSFASEVSCQLRQRNLDPENLFTYYDVNVTKIERGEVHYRKELPVRKLEIATYLSGPKIEVNDLTLVVKAEYVKKTDDLWVEMFFEGRHYGQIKTISGFTGVSNEVIIDFHDSMQSDFSLICEKN